MKYDLLRKLCTKAGYLPDGFGIGHWDMESCHALAELIVKECLSRGDILAKAYIQSHPERDQAFLLAAVADYSAAVKQHFELE